MSMGLRWHLITTVLFAAVVSTAPAQAQTSIRVPPGVQSCLTVTMNSQGSSGADITIDNTAGGVSVMLASTTRCAALIRNSGSNQMRCGPTSQTLTATAYGIVVDAGQALTLGPYGEVSQAWKCIRTGGSSTTANIAESTP